jgi:predicted SAM-dependent methyltransferase
MKIHIGCGTTILNGFVNIDNSPTALFSKLPGPILSLLARVSLLNHDQEEFAKQLRARKKDFLYADCMKMPLKDNSVDFAYSSHMLGWCLGQNQIRQFLQEVYRVLRPGGGVRFSFFDFDKLLADYQQHRNTIQLMEHMPLGAAEFSFSRMLKLLLSPNMQNGLPLNVETFSRYLEGNGFCDIGSRAAGETGMDAQWVEGLDLYQRSVDSIYIEARKGDR